VTLPCVGILHVSCIEHVFKYEFEAARAVITNPDVGDPSINPKVLWQALRTITVQESFMRVGFKNHSSLASAYSRFLLTQYQQTALELSRVSKEAELYKSKIADLAGIVEALDKRMRAAEGTANAAKNAMERMSKREGKNSGS
jgi:outer membrane murein-binding lipoprotein Lpp